MRKTVAMRIPGDGYLFGYPFFVSVIPSTLGSELINFFALTIRS